MSRELLRRAIYALHELQANGVRGQSKLIEDIRAELEKPEPVECGWIDTRYGILYNGWMTDNLGTGKYRLLAEKIDG